MYILESKIENIIQDFPIVNDWLDNIFKNILKQEKDISKILSAYTFIYVKDRSGIDASKMLYDERLNFEMSKIRIDVNFRIGKSFNMSNRLPIGIIPSIIVEYVSQLTKFKIILETKEDPDGEIRNSIPDLDVYQNFIDQIDNYINNSINSTREEFSMDGILDKISSHGINSLTKEELDFLNINSKK